MVQATDRLTMKIVNWVVVCGCKWLENDFESWRSKEFEKWKIDEK